MSARLMAALVIITLTLILLYVLYLLPQRRQMQAHQQLVASLAEGDEVIMSAGLYGRVVSLGAEDLMLEVAPGVELRFARGAVMRRVDDTVGTAVGAGEEAEIDSGRPDGNNAGLAGGDAGDGLAPGAN